MLIKILLLFLFSFYLKKVHLIFLKNSLPVTFYTTAYIWKFKESYLFKTFFFLHTQQINAKFDLTKREVFLVVLKKPYHPPVSVKGIIAVIEI